MTDTPGLACFCRRERGFPAKTKNDGERRRVVAVPRRLVCAGRELGVCVRLGSGTRGLKIYMVQGCAQLAGGERRHPRAKIPPPGRGLKNDVILVSYLGEYHLVCGARLPYHRVVCALVGSR